MCAGLRGQRAEEIAEEDRLGQVVTLVTVLPIDPHVLDAKPAAVAGLAHDVDDAPIVDGVAREALLQTVPASTAGVEVAGVLDQRLDLRIGQAGHVFRACG